VLSPDNRFSLSHTYASPGAYTVTVTVTGGLGGVGTGTLSVTVLPPRPTATAITAPDITYSDDGVVTITVTSAVTPAGMVTLSVDGGPAVAEALDANGTAA